MTIRLTVENSVQAREQVDILEARGYSREDIYIFAHSKERTEHIAHTLDTEKVGLLEDGLFLGVKNLFTSRDEELRHKMESIGLTPAEAVLAEAELEEGKLVIVLDDRMY